MPCATIPTCAWSSSRRSCPTSTAPCRDDPMARPPRRFDPSARWRPGGRLRLTNDDGPPIYVHPRSASSTTGGPVSARTTSTAGPGPATARSRVLLRTSAPSPGHRRAGSRRRLPAPPAPAALCRAPGHRGGRRPRRPHELFDLLVDSATAPIRRCPRAPVTSPAAYVGQWRGSRPGGGGTPGRAGAVATGAACAADILSAAPASRNGHRASCGC